MADDLTEDMVQEYQEAFALFDKDGNGSIEAKGSSLWSNSGAKQNTFIFFIYRLSFFFFFFFFFISPPCHTVHRSPIFFCIELAEVLTALGQSPSEEDISKMIKEVDADVNGSIEFPEFLKMMASRHRVVDNEEEIQEAFKVFADSSGEMISVDTLKKSMMALKETFTDDEINTMIKISGSGGKVSYSQFKNMMTTK